ncbi:MAG TPA: glycosyltransferase [Steroidobacteraceae bacterium]|nr:glycosyltransferase [Steroidobacteraceae bacterium]
MTAAHLHFTQSLEPLQGGGLGSSAVALHSHMVKAGLRSVLCSTYGTTPQRKESGIAEYRRSSPDFLYYSPALRRDASSLVRDSDVLHGHGLYVGTNFLFGGEARRQRKALVYHVHGMFEPYILKRSRWKKRLVHWLFENRNIRDVRFWRALTTTEAAQIAATGARQPIAVIPNGLDVADFTRPADLDRPIQTPLVERLSKRSRRLLFLGRIHPKKGLMLLLPAWAKVQAADWELVIAGPDEGGHLQEVRTRAAELGIADRVIFTGLMQGEEKVRLLHTADLFVLPSFSEGLPMGVLEALACGVPVVATRESNVGDLMSDGAGWECSAAVDSLAEALGQALAATESERAERGSTGRRTIEARYGWPSVVKELERACVAYC